MKPSNHEAVSPVIGVMLMLVVTIIIAAVVSAYAGSTVASSQKSPQATIKGVFSQSGGMQIINTGGDTLPTANLIFTVSNDAAFGQALGTMTTQVVDKTIITDINGNPLSNSDGSLNIISFGAGQTLYINQTEINCKILQPQVAPNSGTISYNNGVWSYSGTMTAYWAMCFTNPDNVGKTFTLLISDKSSGTVMAKTTVLIKP
ncbi:MAG: type IV pilin N-terminal domain-containing protein [Methanoregula sp.]|nr:type IV pilin N-terminal domain-containing protein [Methanoregula sp.]